MNLLEALHNFAMHLINRGPADKTAQAINLLHDALVVYNPQAAAKLEQIESTAIILDAVVNTPAPAPSPFTAPVVTK
jgi:hypothetical protein